MITALVVGRLDFSVGYQRQAAFDSNIRGGDVRDGGFRAVRDSAAMRDIATGVSWTLLLFLGGIFGLGNVIVDTKVTDWMAGLMLPRVEA